MALSACQRGTISGMTRAAVTYGAHASCQPLAEQMRSGLATVTACQADSDCQLLHLPLLDCDGFGVNVSADLTSLDAMYQQFTAFGCKTTAMCNYMMKIAPHACDLNTHTCVSGVNLY